MDSDSCDKCSINCPNLEECIGEGIKFERLRRITGYLVGTVDRWNDGKRAELKDREVHIISESSEVNNDKSSQSSSTDKK